MDDSVTASHPALAFDRFLADPLGSLAAARLDGPVARNDLGPMVLGHDAVREVLADRRYEARFTEVLHRTGITGGAFHEWMARSPLDRDGEDHRRWRALMSRTFTPRSVERLRPALEAITEHLVDGFVAEGRCEFMAEVADLLPSWGLGELIGVPDVRNYDGSWTEWGSLIGAPIER